MDPPEANQLSLKNENCIRLKRKYELITPLFGGGVEPGVNDNITPINGKTIRGHLRFWWRATRGGQFGGGDEGLRRMKALEDRIWGAASTKSASNPSAVQIEVELGAYQRIGSPEAPYVARHRPNPDWAKLIYAAFPLQDDPHSVSRFRFDLKVRFPETLESANGGLVSLAEEIEATLWAWQTFGGVGARTRRGFGAIKRADEPHAWPKEPEKIEERIKTELKNCVSEGDFPLDVPHLSKDLSFALATTSRMVQVGPNRVSRLEPYDTADDAWEALIVELKNFRQARTGAGGFGRSKWNEPERIREITGQRLPAHAKNESLASIKEFPRAAFGQPILFQFHRDQKNPSGSSDPRRDPVDTILKGGRLPGQANKTRERLASPLILKPLSCAGTKAVGLAAILKGPRVSPEGLYLSGERVNQNLGMRITKKEGMSIEPLRDFAARLGHDDDELDVLEAFIDRFRR